MIRKIFLTGLLVVWMIPSWAWSHVGKENVVNVRFVSNHGNEFPKYKVYPQVRPEGNFFYVEATQGTRYSVQVTNRSGKRIGVVIAVDGRNIIDGRRSELNRNERMYIIGPYQSNSFEGWRTGMDSVCRRGSQTSPTSRVRKSC